MSGSQVFYMGDNGEVVLWDGTTTIEGSDYCVTMDGGVPVFSVPGPTGDTEDRYIDYDIGYAQAIRDVLVEIAASGKQNLVQWLEARLKDLP